MPTMTPASPVAGLPFTPFAVDLPGATHAPQLLLEHSPSTRERIDTILDEQRHEDGLRISLRTTITRDPDTWVYREAITIIVSDWTGHEHARITTSRRHASGREIVRLPINVHHGVRPGCPTHENLLASLRRASAAADVIEQLLGDLAAVGVPRGV